jgi:hypothetical protein
MAWIHERNAAWSVRYFAVLVWAILLIPTVVYAVVTMTAVAAEAYLTWGIDETYYPAITRVCVKLGPVGLAIAGAVCPLVLLTMLRWRTTARATVISTIILLAWLGFYLVAFFAAVSCMITL